MYILNFENFDFINLIVELIVNDDYLKLICCLLNHLNTYYDVDLISVELFLLLMVMYLHYFLYQVVVVDKYIIIVDYDVDMDDEKMLLMQL
jgi:hypothetical protein